MDRQIRQRKGYGAEEPSIALFVDGPNMLRKEFMVDLRELKKKVQKYGRIVVSKVFVNQFAPEKLIEAIQNEGFESLMTLGEQEEGANDVDVGLTVSVMETILTKDIDIIAIASRDADYLPVIQKCREYGKAVIVLGADPGFSASIRNAADFVEML